MSSTIIVDEGDNGARLREIIYGVKAIAHALGISLRTFHRLMKSERPIPLYADHRGIFAIRSELQIWVNQGTAPYRVWQAARRASGRAA